jgi:lipoprotein LprG
MSVAGTIPGFPIQKLDGDVTSTPAAGQGNMDMLFAGSALKDIGYVVVDGTFFAALTPGTWTDFGPAADIFDMTAFLSPSSGLGPVLTTFADPKLAGQESINGVTTTRVDGQVSPSAVNALFPAVKATAPVPATAWIDPATQRLVQLELTPMSGSSIRVTMSNWDKPVTITKPAA